jgi:hypothetical protein
MYVHDTYEKSDDQITVEHLVESTGLTQTPFFKL